jgi:hypothetical protein
MGKQVTDKKTLIILFISTLSTEKIVKESLKVGKTFLHPKWISHVPRHNVCRLALMNAQNTSSYNKIV